MLLTYFVESYLSGKANAWSLTTLKSERARLNSSLSLLEMAPEAAYEALKARGLSSYTIKTTFVRFASFYDWMIANGHTAKNPFSCFIKEQANLFKHSYRKERIGLTFTEAASRIELIPDLATREKAKRLLIAGLRYSESYTEKDGEVVGKGGKVRKVFAGEVGAVLYDKSYSTFRRHLAQVGLKPHTLRKLFATNLVANGAQEADLLQLLGWSSIQTAASYLQPRRDEQLAALVSNPFSS